MPEKTVLITGCNHGGLGAAMAKVYRAKGFKVFATVRELGKAGALGDMSGIEILELEVTSRESIQECVKTIEKITGGSLDILVNNAGVAGAMPLLDLDLDKAKRFSRAATTALSETLRIEMAPLGVRVVTVILGAVETSGNCPSKKGDIELPANSYYQKIRDVINQYHKGLVFTKKQNVDVAANNVVNDTLKGGGIFIRCGESSTTSRYANNTFLPHARFTSMINGKSGLAQLGG
ncbi:hypothetical protein CHU98_g6848 [Xylaria longipes]|nr:hypothetical protein CHU98_g6848 [Xylaria longipes]